MTGCAYAERVEDDLFELETRWKANDVREADLYFLQNMGVLVDCALKDFGCVDESRRDQNLSFNTNCMLKEQEATSLKAQLNGMIGSVQAVLAARSVAERGGNVRVRLEQMREQAWALETSLAELLGEAGGGERVRKRASFGGFQAKSLKMSELLAHMRAM